MHPGFLLPVLESVVPLAHVIFVSLGGEQVVESLGRSRCSLLLVLLRRNLGNLALEEAEKSKSVSICFLSEDLCHIHPEVS